MCSICGNEELHVNAQLKQYDPTRTTALRNAFVKKMNSKFTGLIKGITVSVGTNDCFGLRNNPQTNEVVPIPENTFAFLRNAQKLEAFKKWLQQQIDVGILDIGYLPQLGTGVDSYWSNVYVMDAYKRGIIRARAEMISAGMNIPSVDSSGGVLAILSTPFHIDRLALIYSRTYSDLKGITDAMDATISRILAQGLADGDDPILLARKLVAAINGTGLGDLSIGGMSAMRRAEILARTEIIRAHHLAMIQEYRNWGLAGVHVKAEWRTAGDHRVCNKCAKLQGQIYTLDIIENLIPLHPLCRCIALPFLETNII